MKVHGLRGLLLGACLLSVQALQGAEPVFAFSNPSQIGSWQVTSRVLEPLGLSKRFAGSGGYSFRFASPVWRGDMPEWPSCESTPELKDWSGYDRLVMDVTNPGNATQTLSFFASDSKIPVRRGLHGRCRVEGRESKRFVFPLSRMPKKVNRKDMSRVHFFTQRPGENMEIFVSSMQLLRPGEAMPGYSQSFTSELAELYKPLMVRCRERVQAAMACLGEYDKIPQLHDYIVGMRKQFDAQMVQYHEWLNKADVTVDKLQEMRAFVSDLDVRSNRLEGDLKMLKEAVAAGQDLRSMMVGTASTMVKVMPRDVRSDLEIRRSLSVSLARNEREGIQVVVKALLQDLSDVKVTVSELKHDSGRVLRGVEVDVVGYVETKVRPPYVVSYVGWWPDPLLRYSGYDAGLDRCGSVSVKSNDLQAFWLRFHTSKDELAGVYRGTVTVSASGVKPYTLPISVRVYPFSLPDNTPLPTAISFNPPKKQMTQKDPYDKMKFVYADFLSDYKIDAGYLYNGKAPEWDVLTYLHKKGRLTAFNLGYFGVSEKNFDKAMPRLIKRFRTHYEKAKELGLLDYAYLYGFDEAGKDRFGVVEKCYAELRKAFPEVLTMTTTYDNSYGMDSIIKSVQAWCPLTPRYDLPAVKKAWDSGRWVWWYICCGPHNPHANWFVEYAAIEARQLMGAQTVKYRPDGFLYYALTIWNENMGIDCSKGPFTNWNPVSWTVYHGDGSVFYCDKDGYPLPSIRLENYRDGQEDYAYACILEEAIKRMKSKQALTAGEREWLKEAESALVVPETLVKDMKEYSHDPRVLQAWRDRMGEVISASGLTDLNPWRGVYGVRGWRK